MNKKAVELVWGELVRMVFYLVLGALAGLIIFYFVTGGYMVILRFIKSLIGLE